MKAEKRDIYGDRKNNAAFMTTEKKETFMDRERKKMAFMELEI